MSWSCSPSSIKLPQSTISQQILNLPVTNLSIHIYSEILILLPKSSTDNLYFTFTNRTTVIVNLNQHLHPVLPFYIWPLSNGRNLWKWYKLLHIMQYCSQTKHQSGEIKLAELRHALTIWSDRPKFPPKILDWPAAKYTQYHRPEPD